MRESVKLMTLTGLILQKKDELIHQMILSVYVIWRIPCIKVRNEFSDKKPYLHNKLHIFYILSFT